MGSEDGKKDEYSQVFQEKYKEHLSKLDDLDQYEYMFSQDLNTIIAPTTKSTGDLGAAHPFFDMCCWFAGAFVFHSTAYLHPYLDIKKVAQSSNEFVLVSMFGSVWLRAVAGMLVTQHIYYKYYKHFQMDVHKSQPFYETEVKGHEMIELE